MLFCVTKEKVAQTLIVATPKSETRMVPQSRDISLCFALHGRDEFGVGGVHPTCELEVLPYEDAEFCESTGMDEMR